MSQPSSDIATSASAPPCVGPAEQTDRSTWFEHEVQPHDGQLKSWLRGQFPGIRDVDDVVQESYLRVWKAKAKQPIQSAKAFLFKVARHLALDHLRHLRSSPIDATEDLAGISVISVEPDAARALIDRELLECLGDAIIALPAHYRDVIILHKIHGLPQREVATRLGISPKSVEKYVQRGLVRIGNYIRARGIHEFSR